MERKPIRRELAARITPAPVEGPAAVAHARANLTEQALRGLACIVAGESAAAWSYFDQAIAIQRVAKLTSLDFARMLRRFPVSSRRSEAVEHGS